MHCEAPVCSRLAAGTLDAFHTCEVHELFAISQGLASGGELPLPRTLEYYSFSSLRCKLKTGSSRGRKTHFSGTGPPASCPEHPRQITL